MRVFAVSDIHIDYPENFRWVQVLSNADFQEDTLIVAGDLTDKIDLLAECLSSLAQKFKYVCFTPGNHELWVRQDRNSIDSIKKWQQVLLSAEQSGVHVRALDTPELSIVPLFGWYDFSFGEPNEKLAALWNDFRHCKWPSGFEGVNSVAAFFLEKNMDYVQRYRTTNSCKSVITFSHFLPRIDLLPFFARLSQEYLFPVFGSVRLGSQVEQIKPSIHIYGHSHLNTDRMIGGIRYVNNAYAYPSENMIARKQLYEVLSC